VAAQWKAVRINRTVDTLRASYYLLAGEPFLLALRSA
jgi:hypothetical protein